MVRVEQLFRNYYTQLALTSEKKDYSCKTFKRLWMKENESENFLNYIALGLCSFVVPIWKLEIMAEINSKISSTKTAPLIFQQNSDVLSWVCLVIITNLKVWQI